MDQHGHLNAKQKIKKNLKTVFCRQRDKKLHLQSFHAELNMAFFPQNFKIHFFLPTFFSSLFTFTCIDIHRYTHTHTHVYTCIKVFFIWSTTHRQEVQLLSQQQIRICTSYRRFILNSYFSCSWESQINDKHSVQTLTLRINENFSVSAKYCSSVQQMAKKALVPKYLIFDGDKCYVSSKNRLKLQALKKTDEGMD